MNLSQGITPTDGIGELWFRNESDMFAALGSPQFAAANPGRSEIPRPFKDVRDRR